MPGASRHHIPGQIWPLSQSSILSRRTEYGYDAYGNRVSTKVTGPDIQPRTTTMAYDASGMFPISTTNALGHKETYVWDARLGKKTSLTGPNGLTTRWSYDGFGRTIAGISGTAPESRGQYTI